MSNAFNAAAPRALRPVASVPAEDRVPATLWLNVGYEADGKFINLPTGIAIDTAKALPIKGDNADWNATQTARNDLLAFLQAEGNKLEDGQAVMVSLQLQLRKTKAATVVEADANPYKIDLASIISAAS